MNLASVKEIASDWNASFMRKKSGKSLKSGPSMHCLDNLEGKGWNHLR